MTKHNPLINNNDKLFLKKPIPQFLTGFTIVFVVVIVTIISTLAITDWAQKINKSLRTRNFSAEAIYGLFAGTIGIVFTLLVLIPNSSKIADVITLRNGLDKKVGLECMDDNKILMVSEKELIELIEKYSKKSN